MSDGLTLDIVDESGDVIGKATREEIHRRGLLHREVYVWLYNRKGDVFFQERDPKKDLFPGMLDASIGGHVERGDSYEHTAQKEAKEETGLVLDPQKLKFINMVRRTIHDPLTGKINNVIHKVFIYEFDGVPKSLKIERGKGDGFLALPIDSLFDPDNPEKKNMVQGLLEDNAEAFRQIRSIIGR